jgi:FlaA1/EpsC-like NDP-sugar epimerase
MKSAPIGVGGSPLRTTRRSAGWAVLYWLRFNLDGKESTARTCCERSRGFSAAGRIFLALGLYRGLAIRGILDLQRIVLSAALGAIIVPLVLVMLRMETVVPRSVLILYPIVLIFMMAGSRFAYRV